MTQSEKGEILVQRHPSPPLGPLAIIFTIMFCAGLLPVTSFGGAPYFPGPWESAQTIDTFFRLRPLLLFFAPFCNSVRPYL